MSSRYCEWAAMLETIGSRLNVNIPRCTLAVLGQVWSMQNGKKKKKLLLVWIEFAGFQKLHWLNSSNIYQADFNSQSSRVTNLCSKWLAGQNFGDLNRKQWIKCFYLWHVKFFIVQCMYSGCMFLFLSVKSSFLYRSDNTQLKKMKTR